jgi:hypothetical protein
MPVWSDPWTPLNNRLQRMALRAAAEAGRRAYKMKGVGRLGVGGAVLAASILLVCLAQVIGGHAMKRGSMGGRNDWLILLLPVFPPVVTILSWAGVRWVPHPRTLVRGFLIGVASVSSVYILIPAVYLVWQYRLIAADGTAYWALLALPAFWLWLPAAAVAAVGGPVVAAVRAYYGLVRKRRSQ